MPVVAAFSSIDAEVGDLKSLLPFGGGGCFSEEHRRALLLRKFEHGSYIDERCMILMTLFIYTRKIKNTRDMQANH